MNTQNFVVLGKGMAFCVNIGGIDLQKYFIDKQCLYSVTDQIWLSFSSIRRKKTRSKI